MAHFAKINNNNIVETVEVVANSDSVTEQAGIDFLRNLYNDQNAIWVQTSYNTRRGTHYQINSETPSEDQSKALRKNFATIGGIYDSSRDAFMLPQPFPSWTLNETTCLWEAPTAYPNDGKYYTWNEDTTSWDLV